MHASEPYVIAVNGGAVPHVYSAGFPLRIVGVLFSFGPETVSLPAHQHLRRQLLHASGRDYEKDWRLGPDNVFRAGGVARISAVVYSTAEEFNCRGNFGAGLILIHNPMAAAPLPRGYLPVGRECWREGNKLVPHDHDVPAAPCRHAVTHPGGPRCRRKVKKNGCASSAFLAALGMVPTRVEDSEAPDFLVHFGDELVGIEITKSLRFGDGG